MPTDWLPAGFVSPFEECKDGMLKCALMEHGQWVTFKYVDGDADELVFAYFEREHEEVTVDADVAFSTREPVVECRYADFTKVPNVNDTIEVIEQLGDNAVMLTFLYKICDRHEPDEQGAIMFKLELINGTRTTATP